MCELRSWKVGKSASGRGSSFVSVEDRSRFSYGGGEVTEARER